MIQRKTVRRRTPQGRASWRLFATTAAGLEPELADELRRLGARRVEERTRGVAFVGDLQTVYRANLWLRCAHRVLLEVNRFPAAGREELYEGVWSVDWSDYLSPDGTLAVDAVSHRSELTHTQFIAQVVKDAVVDQFRSRTNRRPSVDRHRPDLRLNARLQANRCTLSVDTSGERLHRRGYRPTFGLEAPLKETLAAGILLKSGYHTAENQDIVDPMCGSGTLLVEAALIARNMAPGLLRQRFGFERLPEHDQSQWQAAVEEARAAARDDDGPRILGSDISSDALRATRAAVAGAGVDHVVRVRKADLAELTPCPGGRLVTNPPYGARIGDVAEIGDLYERLGDTLKRRCTGMSAHVMASSTFLAGRIGLRTHQRDVLYNGAIECRLLHFRLW